jgi:phosphatidylserine/phosphatidylglycerophosphate/cardiolipin synthase-like enzyme
MNGRSLLGRRQSRLIIGSHNVTLAGFGLNREITTAFDVQPSGPTGAAAREVWRFVRAWTSAFSSRMQDVIAATERVAPWLAASNQEQTPYPTVLCTLPSWPTLWQRLKPLMRQPVKRIFIISPYFDSRLRFLRTLEKELSPKECVVAVHPKFTEIAATAPSLLSRSRFVGITQFGETWAEDNLVDSRLVRSSILIPVTGLFMISFPTGMTPHGTQILIECTVILALTRNTFP